ncbi:MULTISPECIES: hypothetical protein [unclassified Pseudactinotalea]|uniref:hypothetical protein n=1 Tax=unclassified Pseudactinotalea TaxID=2649176 RepID=UPI00128CE312|nr:MULTISPECIES: hypothetical protein [unclassified Pseudactinotalea]MPV48713.1 hypothetical protein [Pseudactinotalea sp. HY160]QGH68705.1 hypothetical protein GCE65_03715 [Pseudactinotalea sp. HY158]
MTGSVPRPPDPHRRGPLPLGGVPNPGPAPPIPAAELPPPQRPTATGGRALGGRVLGGVVLAVSLGWLVIVGGIGLLATIGVPFCGVRDVCLVPPYAWWLIATLLTAAAGAIVCLVGLIARRPTLPLWACGGALLTLASRACFAMLFP